MWKFPSILFPENYHPLPPFPSPALISFNERPTKLLFFNDRANCRMEGEGEGGIRPRGPRNAQYLPPTVTFRGFIRPPVDRQNNEVAAVWKPAEKWPFFAIACISAYLNRRPASISLFRKRPLRDVTPDRWHRINFLRGRGPFEWVADRIRFGLLLIVFERHAFAFRTREMESNF